MAPKVLLTTTTGWSFVARLAGAFASLGASVEALAPRNHVLAKHKDVAKHHVYRPRSEQRGLRAAIGSAKPDLIVACDERALAELRRCGRQAKKRGDGILSALVARSLGNPPAFKQLGDRAGFLKEAESLGIRVAKTVRVDSLRALDDAIWELGLPAAVKLDGTSGGDGVVIARSLDEARDAFKRLVERPSLPRRVFRALARKDSRQLSVPAAVRKKAVTVQQFIAGRPATLSFAAWQGRIVASLPFDVVVTEKSLGPASVLRRSDDRALEDAARKVAAYFGLSGLHGLDFMRDADGKAWLIECNPRATPTSHLGFGEGRDLVAALLGAMHGWPVAARRMAEKWDTIALFPQEWRRNPQSPHIAGAYHDVPWNEPALLRALMAGTPAPVVNVDADLSDAIAAVEHSFAGE